jgi:hypothetical protein
MFTPLSSYPSRLKPKDDTGQLVKQCHKHSTRRFDGDHDEGRFLCSSTGVFLADLWQRYKFVHEKEQSSMAVKQPMVFQHMFQHSPYNSPQLHRQVGGNISP